MEGKARGCSSSEDSDDEVYLQNASDEDELGSSSGSMPKLQFRSSIFTLNMKSKGCWNEEMGMGEVIEKNGKMWINYLRPDFDVYLPNSRFRKSSPGDPSFLLYLSRGIHAGRHATSLCGMCGWGWGLVRGHPSRAEIEALERQCGGIPLKICLATEGRVSFFSFDKVELPVLP
ncbi:hypothetical protein JHK85_054330 [Glycine max]|nr:hypothetical protein JHK85_054330 [Glycine max]